MSLDVGTAVANELETLRGLHSRVRKISPQPAAVASDLSLDERRFPDIWATSVVRRCLDHAAESAEAACALILSDDWISPQFTLLRGTYESAGMATWLLVPDDPDTRLARLLWQHRDSWKFAETAYSGTPLGVDEQQERQEWADSAAEKLGVNIKVANPGGFQSLIKSIDSLPQHPESLLTAWRLCSGVSHAKTWALNEVTTVKSIPLYEHGELSQREPNREFFLTELQIARRVVQHAVALLEIRTTPRPHSLSVKLVRLDQAGNSVPEDGTAGMKEN
ncbi:hypothetical protein [Gordonia sp. CPCC 205333]|uniref:hypothetical protein n=1 Tax=Gordonia sp. CPCC 205333 TaxID=3140790 RepID=UPI003AF369E9